MEVKQADLQFWVDICKELNLIHRPVDVAALIAPGTPTAK
jgi:hypothetical protein